MTESAPLRCQCCIAGGGPAGIMLGYLLARAGVEVIVVEKHKDFFRDFRGDTIHASTLDVMQELGILDDLLKLPHQEYQKFSITLGDKLYDIADLTRLDTVCHFVAFMPQWDFLNFLAERAKRFPSFHLLVETEVTDILVEDDRVCGVKVRQGDRESEIHADLVVGADGRHSAVREKAGLKVIEYGVPIDVLWLRIPKDREHETSLGYLAPGKLLVLIDRFDYWQCGYLIRKGAFEEIRKKGLESFRSGIADLAPITKGHIEELRSWDDVRLLSVQIDLLEQWSRPGLLCIGDSAHAMSPAGGVGINLAIQDAVAASNILGSKLLAGSVLPSDLERVQTRREPPTKKIQAAQRFIHANVVNADPSSKKLFLFGLALRLLNRFPYLQQFPARFVGLGPLPEHVAD